MARNLSSPSERVVILIDMDCFYCQVVEKLDPNLQGKPVAVVQYNPFMGGGIIAVNYPARDKGVTRHMRGFEAKKTCPSIELVPVPEQRGKADLTKFRNAGKQVADVLQTFTPLLERASVDEAYLDITDAVNQRIEMGSYDLDEKNLANTFFVGSDTVDFLNELKSNPHCNESNLKLAVGGIIAEEIRAEVDRVTGYKCSAGVAHNKVLAKLVCALHKPNKQTILPQEAVEEFFKTMPVTKIPSLGGKFGKSLSEDFGIQYVGDLVKFTENDLKKKFDDKTGTWLYDIARGINFDPVTTKLISKSIGCCKNFPGPSALSKPVDIQHWLSELSEELCERLDGDLLENNRKAKSMVVSFHQENGVASSRTVPLPSYDATKIAQVAYEVVKRNCMKSDGRICVRFLGISCSNFDDVKNVREITSFFKVKPSTSSEENFNVYSDDTLELDENVEEMDFYDDCHKIEAPETSSRSLVKEIRPEESFFKRYFQSKQKEETIISPTSDIPEPVIDVRELQTCPECNKNFPPEEFISHQDYHFALKLSKEQRTVPSIDNVKKVESRMKNKSKKRKQQDNINTSILMKFVKTQEDDLKDGDITETCKHCNKKIKIEEFTNHLDYHTAKLLHKELNSQQTPPLPVCKKSNKSTVKNKGKLGQKTPANNQINGLTSFLKQL